MTIILSYLFVIAGLASLIYPCVTYASNTQEDKEFDSPLIWLGVSLIFIASLNIFHVNS